MLLSPLGSGEREEGSMSSLFVGGHCPVCGGARKYCQEDLSTRTVYCRHEEANPADYECKGVSDGYGRWRLKEDIRKEKAQETNPETPWHIEEPTPVLPWHLEEWSKSQVDEKIIELNVKYLTGEYRFNDFPEIWEYLFYSDKIRRRNTGLLPSYYLRIYKHIENGGWYASGIDLLSENCALPSEWGCLKPKTPRRDKKNKIVKYEHPVKVSTEVFALRVPLLVWQKIAEYFNVPIPEAIEIAENGEALGFWQWVVDHPEIPIILTEGVKKAGAGLTAGYVTIALPGIFNGYRTKDEYFGVKHYELIPQLEKIAVPGREIIFAFDQDSKPKTRINVAKAIARLSKLLEAKGCTTQIASWDPRNDGKETKGLDDLIAVCGEDAFHFSFETRISTIDWAIENRLECYMDLSAFNPTRIWKKYLTEEDIDPLKQLVFIKSEKCTGKTTLVSNIIKPLMNDGERIFCPTHLIQLGKATANKFGIEYILDVKKEEHGGLFGYVACADSMHEQALVKFTPEGWGLIFLDEAEKFIWHLLYSKTQVAYRRAEIILNFRALLRKTIKDGGKIIVADADLTGSSIRFILGLLGDLVPPYQVIENRYRPSREQKRKAYCFQQKNPLMLLRTALDFLHQGKKIMICIDGRKEQTLFSTKTLKRWFSEQLPDKQFLTSDSQTCSDPEHPSFGISINLERIKQYDALIASPTFAEGLSIELQGHFDAVFAIAQGVMSVDTVLQFLDRVRSDAPRYIWARTAGISRIGNGSHSARDMLVCENKQTKTILRMLREADYFSGENSDIDFNFEPTSQITWAAMGARKNFETTHYRKAIQYRLSKSGYEIVEIEETDTEEEKEESSFIKEQLKGCRDNNYSEWRAQISAAAKMTDEEYTKARKCQEKSKEMRARERKKQLERRYETENITPELVEKDDKRWYPKLRLHYYLSFNRGALAYRERAELHPFLEDEKAFRPDFNRAFLSPSVKLWECLDMNQFFDSGKRFTTNGLKKWHEKIMLARGEILNYWKIRIDPKRKESAIQLVQRILRKLLGLKLELVDRRGPRGQEERYYRGADINADGRMAVIERWLESDRQAGLT